MSTDYYNTTKEEGTELVESTVKAIKQTDAILNFFQRYPDQKCTAEFFNKIVLPKAFRTSIRRALTNLEEDGLIVCVGQTRSDDTQKKIKVYMLNPNPTPASVTRINAVGLLYKCKETLKLAMETQKLDFVAQMDFMSLFNELNNFLINKRIEKEK